MKTAGEGPSGLQDDREVVLREREVMPTGVLSENRKNNSETKSFSQTLTENCELYSQVSSVTITQESGLGLSQMRFFWGDFLS